MSLTFWGCGPSGIDVQKPLFRAAASLEVSSVCITWSSDAWNPGVPKRKCHFVLQISELHSHTLSHSVTDCDWLTLVGLASTQHPNQPPPMSISSLENPGTPASHRKACLFTPEVSKIKPNLGGNKTKKIWAPDIRLRCITYISRGTS